MATVLRMPEVTAAATEAVLTEWLLSEGATFAAGDALATVETDKALVDIEADADGTLLMLLVPGGKLADVGAPIAVLAAVGEEVEDVSAVLTSLGVDQDPGSGAPVTDDAETGPAGIPQGHAAASAADVHVSVPAVAQAPLPTSKRTFSSPLARKLAADAGLAIEDIPGTGPRNRVLRRDVEAAIAAPEPSIAPEGPAAIDLRLQPVAAPVAADDYDEFPHTRFRRAIATRLQQSKRDAPHFYLRATIRAGRLLALRADINESGSIRVSVNDLVVKAVAKAHDLVPEMNVIWTDDAVRRSHSVDVAVAVATERGLMTPVVRDVSSLTLTALAAEVRDLATRARDGQLKQDELVGGTISVTNLGMHGVEDFAAVINPPHSAILAVGAIRDEPLVEDGALVVGSVLRVTLSVDHRPVDGAAAARWLQALVGMLEHPIRILA